MARKQPLSTNKKVLQEQVQRLNNEIEELQLEREESKKNVLHFMLEADAAKQELEKAQQLIEGLTSNQIMNGYYSPPPEPSTSTSTSSSKSSKISSLLTKLSQLNDQEIEKLFILVDKQDVTDHFQLVEEYEQLEQEYKVTRDALKIENERAEIMERRWKESESLLEQSESNVQSLKQELNRQQQELKAFRPDNRLTAELCSELKMELKQSREKSSQSESKLEQALKRLEDWKNKHDEIYAKHITLKKKQIESEDQSKIRETHLRTINKTLRDEIRKINRAQRDFVNIEYLRNVIIKFLERKTARHHLVPILSTLLQCSKDDQVKLQRILRNQITS